MADPKHTPPLRMDNDHTKVLSAGPAGTLYAVLLLTNNFAPLYKQIDPKKLNTLLFFGNSNVIPFLFRQLPVSETPSIASEQARLIYRASSDTRYDLTDLSPETAAFLETQPADLRESFTFVIDGLRRYNQGLITDKNTTQAEADAWATHLTRIMTAYDLADPELEKMEAEASRVNFAPDPALGLHRDTRTEYLVGQIARGLAAFNACRNDDDAIPSQFAQALGVSVAANEIAIAATRNDMARAEAQAIFDRRDDIARRLLYTHVTRYGCGGEDPVFQTPQKERGGRNTLHAALKSAPDNETRTQLIIQFAQQFYDMDANAAQQKKMRLPFGQSDRPAGLPDLKDPRRILEDAGTIAQWYTNALDGTGFARRAAAFQERVDSANAALAVATETADCLVVKDGKVDFSPAYTRRLVNFVKQGIDETGVISADAQLILKSLSLPSLGHGKATEYASADARTKPLSDMAYMNLMLALTYDGDRATTNDINRLLTNERSRALLKDSAFVIAYIQNKGARANEILDLHVQTQADRFIYAHENRPGWRNDNV